jgi:hypothetical protein
MRTRVGWGGAIAVLSLALTLAFAGAQGATAVQGQAVIAGQVNTETNATVFNNTSVSIPNCLQGLFYGVQGCGQTGVDGQGGQIGVNGRGSVVGVLATSSEDTGVLASGGKFGVSATSRNGTGVYGKGVNGLEGDGTENGVLATGGTFGVFATGDDYGVYASAPNYGIYGDSQNGTGVTAASENGTALNVQGKIVSKRSGIVTAQASAGLSYVSVTLAKMTASTFIVATVQGNVAGVWVRSVGISPPTNTFKIYLNKVPTADVRIGWFAIR